MFFFVLPFRVTVNGEDVVVAAGGYWHDGSGNVLVSYVDFFKISTWTYESPSPPDMVSGRRHMNSVVIDGLFYFWGGIGSGSDQANGYRMLSNGTWETVPEVMTAPGHGGYAIAHYEEVVRKMKFS